MRFLVTIVLAFVSGSTCCQASGVLPYGSRAGMNVTVVEMKGIGTTDASIRAEHKRSNAKEFCIDYARDNSEQCVDRALRETRLNDTIKANCKDGRFINFYGESLQFAGANPAGTSPRYRILKAGSSEPLDGSIASGYSVNLDQFKALCPEALSKAEAKAFAAHPSYIGAGTKVMRQSVKSNLAQRTASLPTRAGNSMVLRIHVKLQVPERSARRLPSHCGAMVRATLVGGGRPLKS